MARTTNALDDDDDNDVKSQSSIGPADYPPAFHFPGVSVRRRFIAVMVPASRRLWHWTVSRWHEGHQLVSSLLGGDKPDMRWLSAMFPRCLWWLTQPVTNTPLPRLSNPIISWS